MAIEIVAKPHPLRSDTYRLTLPLGATLADLLPDAPETVYAQVNGEPWDRARWREPLPAGVVNLFASPHGSDALRLVAMVAVAVVSAGVGFAAAGALGMTTATGALTFGGSLVAGGIGAGLSVAGSFAVNALIPPKLPDTPDSANSTIAKSLTGTQNRLNPYGVIPRVYGAPRYYPPLAAMPVTEIGGNDQYLRMLLCLGYGPLRVGSHTVGKGHSKITQASHLPAGTLRIGETAIEQYEDVEWEIGTADQLSLFTADIYEEAVSAALDLQSTDGEREWFPDGVSATRTTSANTREISIDLVFPTGVYAISQSGKTNRQGPLVDFRVEYAVRGSGNWVQLPGDSPEIRGPRVWDPAANQGSGGWVPGPLLHPAGEFFRVTAPSKQTVRRNIRWRVPEEQYDVRVTRVHTYIEDREVVQSDAVWTVLRSIRPQRPWTRDDTVLLALRIKATDQLNGAVDQLSVQAQSVLRVWDGNGFSMQPTSNPAWAYLDAMTGAQLGRPIPDSRINFAQLKDWADWCDSQGLKYHWVHDSPETLFERLRVIAAGGQGAFAQQDGLYGVVRDNPHAELRQVITPRNAMGFESARQYRSLPHALRVKYVDPATWQDAERIVYRDGYSAANASIFEDLQTQGVASADEAYHHGMYHFRQALLRPETYQVQMDWEHLALTRGDRARLAYDAILVGLGWGRIRSIDGATIVLDEVLTIDGGTEYGVRIRRQDGSHAVVAVENTFIGSTQELTLREVVEDVCPGDLVLFGELGKESIDCKVIRVEPGPDFSASLTLVDAALDIYDYDSPPVYDPGITRPVTPGQIPPPTPKITNVRGDETALMQDIDGSLRTAVRIDYVFALRVGLPALQVEARYRTEDGAWRLAGPFAASGAITLLDVEVGDEYEVQVRALNGPRHSEWSNTEAVEVTGKTNPPHDVTGFTASQNGPSVVFRWGQVPDRDLEGYRLRYMSQNAPFEWSRAKDLTVVTRGTQVTSAGLPPGVWYVGIKAVDTSENESVNAAVLSVNVINRNDAIYAEAQAPSWPGIRDGFLVQGGALVLDPAHAGRAIYTAPLLAQAFIDDVRVFAEIDASAPDGVSADPQLEVRYSTGLTDDDPMWTDPNALMWTNRLNPMWQSWSTWQPWVVGEVKAELVQHRLVRDVAEGPITIQQFTPVVDVPPRSESASNVSVPAAGAIINFAEPFHIPPTVQVTAAGAAALPAINDADQFGFFVQLYDLSNTPVAGTINWTASTE